MAYLRTYTSDAAFIETHPQVLALYCSDGRFSDGVASLLHSCGKKRFDEMSLPGGPALLHNGAASMVEREAVQNAASFLIQGHNIQEVVLIAHHGCGFYGKRFSGSSAERRYEQQMLDMRKACEWLNKNHKLSVVQGYYARPMDGHVKFDSVELTAPR